MTSGPSIAHRPVPSRRRAGTRRLGGRRDARSRSWRRRAGRAGGSPRASTCPTTWRCWRLAGGRAGGGGPVRRRSRGAGRAARGRARRRRTGAGRASHYTPAPLAVALVARALAERTRARSVGDPACGGGRCSWPRPADLAAPAAMAPPTSSQRLWGADIDPLAVADHRGGARAVGRRRASPAGHLRRAPTRSLDELGWPRARRRGRQPAVPEPARRDHRPAAPADAGSPARSVRRCRAAVHRHRRARSCSCACELAAPGGTRRPAAAAVGRWPPATPRRVRARGRGAGRLEDVWLPDAARLRRRRRRVRARVRRCGRRPRRRRAGARHLARADGVPDRRPAPGRRTVGDEATRPPPGSASEYYGMVAARARGERPPRRAPARHRRGSSTSGAAPGASARLGSAAAPGTARWSTSPASTAAAAAWVERTGAPEGRRRHPDPGGRGGGRRRRRAGSRRAAGRACSRPTERLWPLAARRRVAGGDGVGCSHGSAGTALPADALKVERRAAAARCRCPPTTTPGHDGTRRRSGPATSRASSTRWPTAYGVGPRRRATWWSSGRERSGVRRRCLGRVSPTSGVARSAGSSNLGRTPKVLSHLSGWGCGPGDRATKCSGLDPPRVSAPAAGGRVAAAPTGGREDGYEQLVGLRRAHSSLLPATGAWRDRRPGRRPAAPVARRPALRARGRRRAPRRHHRLRDLGHPRRRRVQRRARVPRPHRRQPRRRPARARAPHRRAGGTA